MAQRYGIFIRSISPPLENYDGMIFKRARVVPKVRSFDEVPLAD